MTERIKELLAVLGVSEDEQWGFLCSQKRIQEICGNQLDVFCQKKYKRRVLADLAFRLRDETVYLRKIEIVFEHCEGKIRNHRNPSQKYFIWWIEQAKPIHWIIAALIAKELSRD